MNQFKSTLLKIFTFFTFVLGIHTSSYGQFEQVYPSEYVSAIDQITFHDSGTAIALLRCNGILRSADHGNTWTYVEISGMASQNNVIFIDNDPKKILISGTYGAFRSDDGGLTFQVLPPPSSNSGLFYGFYSNDAGDVFGVSAGAHVKQHTLTS